MAEGDGAVVRAVHYQRRAAHPVQGQWLDGPELLEVVVRPVPEEIEGRRVQKAFTRSGWRAASSMALGPPPEMA